MVIFKDGLSIQRSWPWWRWILTGLNALALVLSIMMSWHYLKGGSMVGCGGGSPCDQVLNSQWSTIAGVLPISGLAVGIYLAILVAGFYIGPDTELSIRRLAWRMMLILVGSVAGSAVWFMILQKWVIHDFCPYCMTAHLTGTLLAALVLWRAITEFADLSSNSLQKNHKMTKTNISPASPRRILRPLQAVGMALMGLALACMLAAFQVVFAPSTAYLDGESPINLPPIDFHKAPMVGSPDAPFVVVLLFDYQCSHCQKIHFALEEAVLRFNGKLAFVLCPAPLNTQCNPYIAKDAEAFRNSCELAEIGLAVWSAKRQAFPAFENWMFTFDSGERWHPRSLESARAKAIELVGQASFDAATTSPWTEQYLQTCVQIYGQTIQNGKGGIPKLIYGSRWVVPETDNVDDLILILQNSLGVPKP